MFDFILNTGEWESPNSGKGNMPNGPKADIFSIPPNRTITGRIAKIV